MHSSSPLADRAVRDFSSWSARRAQLFFLSIIFPVVALPIVAARLFTSYHIIRKWHVDDTLIIIATVFTLVQTFIGIFEAIYGGGEHIQYVSPKDLPVLLNLSKYGGVISYNLATVFIKLSILFFYLRFAVMNAFRYVVYFVMFVVIAYSIAGFFSFLYGCKIPGSPACQATAKVFTGAAVLNVVTDITILLLPIWILWPMRLPFRYKAAIALIMMTGGFVVAVSIVRLVATVGIGTPVDATYSYGWSILWSVVEAWVGLICANLPCLKAFFSRYLSLGLMKRLIGEARDHLPSLGMVQVDSSRSQRDASGQRRSPAGASKSTTTGDSSNPSSSAHTRSGTRQDGTESAV